jgi:hypothetical protein
MSPRKSIFFCKARGKDPQGAALWGGGCRAEGDCEWCQKDFEGELQGLIIEGEGNCHWKTLYKIQGNDREKVLSDLYLKADAIKANNKLYVKSPQELGNGAILINGEIITMVILAEGDDTELQEAFDDLMAFESQLEAEEE